MTNSKACLAAALCSLLFLSTFLSSAHSASCCLRYSRRRPPCKLLLAYSIQTITGSCDLPAVILHLPGKFLCADPSMRWTQKPFFALHGAGMLGCSFNSSHVSCRERKRRVAQVLNTSAD
uniref:Chemokine interleukin-8-like domain-containing protein n=1 Tax=Oryzias latipes TaxID=8090 RepID=A0A3P9LML6_ORYLA